MLLISSGLVSRVMNGTIITAAATTTTYILLVNNVLFVQLARICVFWMQIEKVDLGRVGDGPNYYFF